MSKNAFNIRKQNLETLLKNQFRSTLLLAAMLPFCASAQGPGWTANSKIVKLVVTATGGINVQLAPDVINCVSQSGYGPNFASIYPNHPGINRIKADLLAAYLAEKTVSLYLRDDKCTVEEIIIGGW